MTKKQEARLNSLMPHGIPRYVRIYDNGGKTFDRYTVVFSGHYRKSNREDFIILGMSSEPYHPMGFCQHDFSQDLIDRPSYGHLGKKITFKQLPEDCQKVVVEEYKDIWDLNYNEGQIELIK